MHSNGTLTLPLPLDVPLAARCVYSFTYKSRDILSAFSVPGLGIMSVHA